jgi:MFS family permease
MSLVPARIYLTTYGVSGAVLSAIPVFLPLMLLDRMPAAAYASLLVVAGLVHMVLVPLLGPATDRFGSARVLVLAEGLYLLNLLFACFCVWGGYSSMAIWAMFYASSGAISALMSPAQATIVQALVPEASLSRYLGIEQAVSVSGRLIGPSLAGLWMITSSPDAGLQAAVGAWLAIWLLHAVVLLTIVRSGVIATSSENGGEGALQRWFGDAREGLLARWRLHTERWLTFQTGVELFIIVPAFSLNLALVVKASSWSSAWLGWLQAACGFGLVAANLMAERFTERFGTWRSAQVSGYVCGASMLAAAAAAALQNPLALCACVLVANYSLGLRISCGRAQRRLAIPKEFLGRFAASHALVNSLAAQFGNAAAAVSFAHFGGAGWYVAGAIGFCIVVAASPLIPDWKLLLSLRLEEAKGFYARRQGELDLRGVQSS